MDPSEASLEDLKEYFQKGLIAFKRGEYFTQFGLSETVDLLPASTLPQKNEKDHPFNKLLRAVATKIVDESQPPFGKKKKAIKAYTERLQYFGSEWQTLIENRTAISESLGSNNHTKSGSDAVNDHAIADAEKESPLQQKDPVVAIPRKQKAWNGFGSNEGRADHEDENKEISTLDEGPRSEPPSSSSDDKRLERKSQFEKERDEILAEVPGSVKERFGTIGFSKWSKELLPVLVLSPFRVPAGQVRDTWFEMFDKVSIKCKPGLGYQGRRLQTLAFSLQHGS